MVAHQISYSYHWCLEDKLFHSFIRLKFLNACSVSAVSDVALGAGETAKKKDLFSCPSVPVWEADQKQVQKTITDTDLQKSE